MKIIHRYLLGQVVRNFVLSLATFSFLFLLFDFFERIDNLLPEHASIFLVIQYFLLKVPLILSLMIPLALLVSVLLTIGLLSKNSEITAMRAAGMPVLWLARPILLFGLLMSLVTIAWNETVVPYSFRRTKEIYNIDIKRKDQAGSYSQTNFWWRSGGSFYTVDVFDSRDNTLYNLSSLELNDKFKPKSRVDASKATFVAPGLGWTLWGINQYRFGQVEKQGETVTVSSLPKAPLVIPEVPQDFYDTRPDEDTMSYRQLKRYIKKQESNGLDASDFYSRLYAKISAPLFALLVIPVVLPFALKTARSGSLALSFIAAFIIAFSYYAIHSFSIALGNAELIPPLLAAWLANGILAVVGLVLCSGAETPG